MKLFTTILVSLGTLVLNVKGATVSPSTWVSIEDTSSAFNGNATSLNERAGTEIVTCYNAGTKASRSWPVRFEHRRLLQVSPFVTCQLNHLIRAHRSSVMGQTLTNGQKVERRYNWGSFTILVSGEAINGCSFKIDGNCNRLLRKPLDECNTKGVNGKQGGFVRDLCGQWSGHPTFVTPSSYQPLHPRHFCSQEFAIPHQQGTTLSLLSKIVPFEFLLFEQWDNIAQHFNEKPHSESSNTTPRRVFVFVFAADSGFITAYSAGSTPQSGCGTSSSASVWYYHGHRKTLPRSPHLTQIPLLLSQP
ncbi:hypothetical protein Hypma_012105 [Hypsizygus marmoreus]|uniref:Uncharacterized protein n=1 Tax=Hypsizygus marmoreus TaxID=39966 RepID=A0A369JEP7_HYPMA|nr:hypothetical protein Hypma_012105 [Hypsizygus marmoreus]